jgi:hypothetical protein
MSASTATTTATRVLSDFALQNIMDRLEELGCSGRGANWQCPVHRGRSWNLRITCNTSGNATVHCHHGCSRHEIREALGLPWQAFYAPAERIWKGSPRPSIDELERRNRIGELTPIDVALGEMPADADADMLEIARDLRVLFGLRRAARDQRPMIYSARWAARRMNWKDHMRAHKAIRRLVEAGVIDRVGTLAPHGEQRRGAALYAPPVLADDCLNLPVATAADGGGGGDDQTQSSYKGHVVPSASPMSLCRDMSLCRESVSDGAPEDWRDLLPEDFRDQLESRRR